MRSLAGLALLLVVLTGCGPFFDPANVQNRADEPAGSLGGDQTIGETFVARCDGLSLVEVQVAIYPTAPPGRGTLTLVVEQGGEATWREVGRAQYDEGTLQPNQWLTIGVKPIARSADQPFRLTARASDAGPSPATLWATTHVTAPDARRFVNGSEVAGRLVLRAWCDAPPLEVARDTIASVAGDGFLWPFALALALIPGLAVARRIDPDEADLAAWLGSGLGWSVLLAPLAWAVATPLRLGLLVGPTVLAVGGVALLAPWFERVCVGSSRGLARVRDASRGAKASGARLTGPALVALAATAGGLGVRLVTSRDLVLPMWVDSVQHSYIVQLLLDERAVPATYGALVPLQVFDYHFGFHGLAAAAAGLAAASPARAVLATGQILNGLVGLAVYRFARDVTGSPRAAAVGALLVSLVTTEPTYFVTWGRYPELAGLVALPVAFAALRRVGGPKPRPADVLVAVAASIGMALVHPRVAVFLGCLVLTALLVEARRLAWPRAVGRLVGVGVISAVLLAPWLVRQWGAHASQTTFALGWQPIDFPLGLATAGADRWLLGLAAVGLAVGLLRGAPVAPLLLGWGLLVLVVANPATFFLPINFWVNNNSVAIAAFFPATVLVGYLAHSVADLARLERWPGAARMTVGAAVLVAGLSQAPGLVSVVNPCCLLAGPADLAAAAWVRANTPATARFVVNGNRWLDETWAGSDAGYWLPVLARRQTTLPPLFYADGPASQATTVSRVAEAISQAGADPVALAALATKLEARYVFVGTTGGVIAPEALARSGRFRVVYRAGGVWVLEVVGEGRGGTGEPTGGPPVGVGAGGDGAPGAAGGTDGGGASGGGARSATVTDTTPRDVGAPSAVNAAGLRSTTSG